MPKQRLCILHVGVPKTGTSALQSFLARSARRLRRYGVLYPKTCRSWWDPAHHNLLREIAGTPVLPGFERLPALLDRERNTKAHDVLLLSSESVYIAALYNPEQQLQRFFGDRGYRLHLVVYLRDQPDFLNAAYGQMVGQFIVSDPIDAYCAWRSERGTARSRVLYHGGLLDRAVFPGEILHYRPFNAALRRSGIEKDFFSTLQGICAEAGLATGVAELSRSDFARTERINESSGPTQIWVARQIAAQLVPALERRILVRATYHPAFARKLARRIKRAGVSEPGYWGFEAEAYRSLRAYFADENERFAEKIWGRGWSEIFPPRPDGKLVSNDLDDVGDEAALSLARRILDDTGPGIEARILRRARKLGS